jgi:hypothetical protein
MTKFGPFEFGLGYNSKKPSLVYRKNGKPTTLLVADTFQQLAKDFIEYYNTHKDDKKNPISKMPIKTFNYAKGKVNKMKNENVINLKLSSMIKEQSDGTATILLLFDKLQNTPSFITAINELKMPLDKYHAIIKFAGLVGIEENKLESFMSNMKQLKSNNG